MPGRIDWAAAIWSGIIAGLIFIAVEMVLVGFTGPGSPWGPPTMIGAIVLGESVLQQKASFDLGVFLVGMAVHLVLSMILAVVFAMIISTRRRKLSTAIGVGTIFGLLVYLVNFYGFTAIFPWFAMARTPVTVVAHLIFGVMLGWSYHALRTDGGVEPEQPPG